MIVPAYDRADLTEQCLTALRDLDGAERVLVDNGSTDRTPDLYPLADTVVRFDNNLGFAAGCNWGAYRARGDRLVFLNNDTIPQPGWLTPLTRALDGVACAGSLLVYPDGLVQHAGVRLQEVNGTLTAFNIGRGQPLGPDLLVARDVEAVTGACLAITKHAFWHAQGFDEGYWNGYEDVDLCLKLRAKGYRIRYVPESRVVHLESESGPARWTAVRQNVVRLQEKWGERWQQIPATSSP